MQIASKWQRNTLYHARVSKVGWAGTSFFRNGLGTTPERDG